MSQWLPPAFTESSLELVSIRSACTRVILLAITALRNPAGLRVGRRELGFLALHGLTQTVDLPGALPGSAPLWLMVLWIIVLGAVTPFLLVLFAVARLGAARVGLIGMLEPVGAGISPGSCSGNRSAGSRSSERSSSW